MNDEKIREAFEERWKIAFEFERKVNYEAALIIFQTGYKSRDKELKVAREALEYVANGGSKPSIMARKTLNILGEME